MANQLNIAPASPLTTLGVGMDAWSATVSAVQGRAASELPWWRINRCRRGPRPDGQITADNQKTVKPDRKK
jgi:hypothetical protein